LFSSSFSKNRKTKYVEERVEILVHVLDYRLRSAGRTEGKREWLGAYLEEAARRTRGKNFSPTLSLPPSHALDKVDAAKDSGSSERSDG